MRRCQAGREEEVFREGKNVFCAEEPGGFKDKEEENGKRGGIEKSENALPDFRKMENGKNLSGR